MLFAMTSPSVRRSAAKTASRLCFAAIVVFGLMPARTAWAETPADQLRKATRDVFGGIEFKNFEFYSPVKSRWGVGTMFERNPAGKGRGAFIADAETWWAPGLTDDEKAALQKQLFIRGELGFHKVTSAVSKSVDIKATLPFTFWKKLLSIDADVSHIKDSTVTITAVGAEERELNFPAFFRAARLGKLSPDVVERVKKADYLIVSKDIVFFGYEATTEGVVQTKLSVAVETLPASDPKKASVGTDVKTGSPPAKGSDPKVAAKEDTKSQDASKATKNAKDNTKAEGDTTQKPAAAAPNGTTAEYKSAADVPMIAAVYVAEAPKIPPSGALSRPTLTPAQIDAEAFSRLVDSLEESLPPPRGIAVVQSRTGR